MRVNSITLVGRAGSDPEVRYYESGSVRAVFDLLVTRRGGDHPDVFPLEIRGKQAQVAADTVRKGSLIGIIGSIHRQPTEDRPEGAIYVRVDRLELLGAPQAVVA